MDQIEKNKVNIFRISTNAAGLDAEITLRYGTWEHHIKPGHKEVAGRLVDVKLTISDPCYIAKSKITAGGRYAGNLVFVRTGCLLGSACMHVFVEMGDANGEVSTAMFNRKPNHGDIIWRRGEAPQDVIGSDYDVEADVLYLYVGRPVPAVTEMDDDGLILRFALDDDRPCGVTVVSYARWKDAHERLAESIANFLHVDRAMAQTALPST